VYEGEFISQPSTGIFERPFQIFTINLAGRFSYVSCIFADPFDGSTPLSAVLHAVKELFNAGCYEVSLGDTLGVGTAPQVRGLIEYLNAHGIHSNKLAGHSHDTYGQRLTNAWQAYHCGIRTFDSSVGGLGGCPFAPGAKGNVATEDIVYLFQNAGIETGVDLDKFVGVGIWISQQLSKPNVSRAGVALWSKFQKSAATQSVAAEPSSDRKTSSLVHWSLVQKQSFCASCGPEQMSTSSLTTHYRATS